MAVKSGFGNATVKIYWRARANGTLGYGVAAYTRGRRVLRSYPQHQGGGKRREAHFKRQPGGRHHEQSQAASFGRAIDLLRPTGVCLQVAAATSRQPQPSDRRAVIRICECLKAGGNDAV